MTVKTFDGLAVASVKTVNAVAIASVKSILGDVTGPSFGTLLLDYDDSQVIGACLQPSANRGTIVDNGNVMSITSGTGKFGSKYVSLHCNGSFLDDYHCPIPGTNDWRASVGAGDFTFSCWIQPGTSFSTPGDFRVFTLLEGTNKKFCVEHNNTIGVWLNGTRYSSATAMSAGWKHFAVVRKSGVVSTWYDGTRLLNQQADTYDWSAINSFSTGTSSGVERGYLDVDDLALFTGATWDPSSATITPPTTKLGAGAA